MSDFKNFQSNAIELAKKFRESAFAEGLKSICQKANSPEAKEAIADFEKMVAEMAPAFKAYQEYAKRPITDLIK